MKCAKTRPAQQGKQMTNATGAPRKSSERRKKEEEKLRELRQRREVANREIDLRGPSTPGRLHFPR